MSVSCRCVISWVSNVTRCLRLKLLFKDFTKAATGFQKIDITDLLGRQEIRLDESRLGAELTGKTILVTGAGGSIGSEICRQVSRFNPERIVLLGHGENSIYLVYHELIRKFQGIDYVPVIADIQDYDRLLQVFEQYKPAIVYHAAAHKHVPMMERNPKRSLQKQYPWNLQRC